MLIVKGSKGWDIRRGEQTENPSVHSRKIEYAYTGLVQVMENLESHGI